MSKSIHTKGAGAQRLTRIPPYLFAEIDRKVQEKKRSGVDVISLGIGDPDLPTPGRIVNVLQEAAADPDNHRYPSYFGLAELRSAIAGWYRERFGVTEGEIGIVYTRTGRRFFN